MPIGPTQNTYVLKNPTSGALESVPADQADQIAASRGLEYATAQDIEDFNRAEKYGSAGQVAQGAAEKVVRGATLGAVEGFDEDARERAQQLERDFPTTSALAGMAPDIALGVVTGGLGGLATGAGRAAAARVGGGLLRRGLAAGAAAATQGTRAQAAALLAAEAGLTGYTAEAEQAFVEDRELSAQAALANGAINFILGGLPLAGARALSGARRPASKLGKNLLAEAEEAASTTASQRGFKRSQKFMSSAPSGEAKSAGSAAADFTDDQWDRAIKSIDDDKLDKEAVFVSENSEPILQMTTTQVADNLDDVKRYMDEGINEAVRAADFRLGAEKWTDEMIEAQDRWVAKRVSKDAQQDVEDILKAKTLVEKGEGWDSGGLGSESLTLLRNNRARVMAAEGADRNIALNQFKQQLDKQIKRVGRSRSIDEGAKAGLTAILRRRADAIREGLEDTTMFGRNADIQRAMNAAWSKTIDPLNRVQNRLMTILGQKYGEIGETAIDKRARSEAVGAVLRQPVEYQREFADDLAAALDGIEDLSLARTEHGLTRLQNMDALRASVQDLRDDFNMAATLQVAKRRAAELRKNNPSIVEAVMAEMAGMATTGLPGVGTAAGKAAKSAWRAMRNAPSMPKPGTPLREVLEQRMKVYATNPRLADPSFSRALPEWMRSTLKGHGGQVAGVAALVGGTAALAPGEASAAELNGPEGTDARTVHALNNVARSTRSRVESAVADLFDAALDRKPGYADPKYRALVRKSERLGQTLTMTRFLGRKHEDPEEAFEAKRSVLVKMMADPSLLVDRMASSWGDLPEQQPEVFSKMVMQATRLVGYLHAKLPASTGKSLLNKNGFPPTLEELEEYAGYWQGAVEPLTVVDDIASGNVADEAMEAVRDNWAPLFREFQGAATAQLQVLMESEREVDPTHLEYLDRVLELEGAGEPMLGWSMALLIEQAENYVAQHPGDEHAGEQGRQAIPVRPIETRAPERMTPIGLQMMKNQA